MNFNPGTTSGNRHMNSSWFPCRYSSSNPSSLRKGPLCSACSLLLDRSRTLRFLNPPTRSKSKKVKLQYATSITSSAFKYIMDGDHLENSALRIANCFKL
uniref:(northern house mosquito) hypothetical protein n=1 Tax=Culex pipiens TaxID=7175 RepID=A0A8D8AZM8_CULPI